MNFTHPSRALVTPSKDWGSSDQASAGQISNLFAAPFDDRVRVLVLQLAERGDYFGDRKPLRQDSDRLRRIRFLLRLYELGCGEKRKTIPRPLQLLEPASGIVPHRRIE